MNIMRVVPLLLCLALTVASPRIRDHNGEADEGKYRPKSAGPEITQGFFAYKELEWVKYLDLSDFKLIVIEDAAFCGLESVTTIDLSSNKLRSIDPTAFVCNTKLRAVNLSKNPRLSLGSNADLLKNDNIMYLDLSFCNFTHISIEAFKHLSNLKWISFQGNRVCAELEKTLPERFPGLNCMPCGDNVATADDVGDRADTREDVAPGPSMEVNPSTSTMYPGGRATGHTSLEGFGQETTESSSFTDSVTKPSRHTESPGDRGTEHTSLEDFGDKATEPGSTQDSTTRDQPPVQQNGEDNNWVVAISVAFMLWYVACAFFWFVLFCIKPQLFNKRSQRVDRELVDSSSRLVAPEQQL